jgi:hypothetical protein
MKKMSWIAGASILIVTTISSPALADHGKVGLWQITTTVKTADAALHSFSSEHCMTAQEVKSQEIPQNSENKMCKLTGQKATGKTLSAQMTCTGQAKGTGKLTVTYDSDTHYTGSLAMTTEAGGQTMHMTNTFDGKWVSADCGKVTH